MTEVHSEPSQTSKMELLLKLVNKEHRKNENTD